MQAIILPVKGLSGGSHTFDFTIGKEFFSDFGNTQIKDAEFVVTVGLQRFASGLQAECHSAGFVIVECDRCLDDLKIPVDVTSTLTVKFSECSQESNDDDVMIVAESVSELDLSQEVYDYICLSLPLQMIHPDGGCNPQMMDYMADGVSGGRRDEECAYSPFENLKELLDNSNN